MEESVEPPSNPVAGQKLSLAMATPQDKVSKSKKVELKRIKKKADLNTSKVQKAAATPKNFRNFGFLNMSIQKQTLRANNKALARDLAKTKQELRQTTNNMNKLKSENQGLKLDLNRLQRLVGLKDEQIDEEVKRRMSEQVSKMYKIVEELVQNVFNTGAHLTELRNTCLEISGRNSTGIGRSSFENMTMSLDQSTEEDKGRNMRTPLSEQAYRAGVQLDRNWSMVDSLRPTISSAVVSRNPDISVIAEQSILGDNEEERVQRIPIAMKAVPETFIELPQRVLRRNDIPDNVNKSKEYENNEMKNKPEDATHSNLFGFGDVDIELVSGSPIKQPDSPKKSVAEAKKVVKNHRKDPTDKGKKPAKPGTVKSQKPEKNEPKKIVSPSKPKRRDTYKTGNPFVPKTQKVLRSPIRVRETADDCGNTLNPFSATRSLSRSPVQQSPSDPTDPFKPTKTLLRSPIAGKLLTPPAIIVEQHVEKVDSRDFIAGLSGDVESNLESETFPEPFTEGESTVFFNTDMELTKVIDITKMIPQKSPVVPITEVIEESVSQKRCSLSKKVSKKSNSTAVKADDKKKTKSVAESTNADTEQEELTTAPVEMRNLKPGIFTFSISRKEADGSRKPVPEKSSRARSKKKPRIMEESEPKVTTSKDMFNFGDRTPTVPLEKLTKPGANVYDMSMNESVAAQKLSLNSFCEKMKDNPTSEGKRKEDEHIYYLPLKGCSDDLPTEKASRSRSKSRKGNISSDDEDWVSLGQKSASKSRSRSKSRKCNISSDDEDWVPLGQKSASKSRSRSKSRKRNISSDNEDWVPLGQKSASKSGLKAKRGVSNDKENDENDKKSKPRSRKRFASGEEDCSPEKVARRSARSRSRSRPKKIIDSVDSEENDFNKETNKSSESKENKSVRKTARSKSRSIRVVESDDDLPNAEETISKECDDDAKKPTRQSARSRSRPRLAIDSDTENTSSISKDKCIEKQADTLIRRGRSKSRPRQVTDSNNEQDTRVVTTNKSTEKDKEVRDIAERSSRSRQRKVNHSDDEECLTENKVRKSRSRSRDELITETISVKRSGRSRSRPRQNIEPDFKKDSPTTIDSATFEDNPNICKRRSARSKPRKEIISDEEISLPKSSNERVGRERSRSRSNERKELISEHIKQSVHSKSRELDKNDKDEAEDLLKLSDSQKGSRTSCTVAADLIIENDVPKIPDTDKQTRKSKERKDKTEMHSKAGIEKETVTSEACKSHDKDDSGAVSDPHVYHLPLKDSPADKEPEMKTSRSRSRGRSRASASEDLGVKRGSRSKSRRRNTESQQDEEVDRQADVHKGNSAEGKSCNSTGLVLPKFNIVTDSPERQTGGCDSSDDVDVGTTVTHSVKSKVLKASAVLLDNEGDITKRTHRRTGESKLSTKTPVMEKDYKIPSSKVTKSQKSKSTMKAKPKTSSKSLKKQKANSGQDSGTPKTESRTSETAKINATRKRLDQAFSADSDIINHERSPGDSSRKPPKSTSKRSSKKCVDGDSVTKRTPKSRPRSKAGRDVDEENAEPVNNLANLKRQLSMISSKARQSVIETDVEPTDAKPLSDIQSNVPVEDDDGSDSKRTRRFKTPISYCPLPLNTKLRRGDPMFDSKISKENAEKARLLLTKKIPKSKET